MCKDDLYSALQNVFNILDCKILCISAYFLLVSHPTVFVAHLRICVQYMYVCMYVCIYIYMSIYIQGDSGGIYSTLGNDSMCDSKQKSSYEHGSDFERLPKYGKKKIRTILRARTAIT